MSKRISKLIERSNYSDRDFQALYSIYKYRCLSFEQIYVLHYNKSKLGTRDVDTGYMRRRMAQFKKDGLIEKMAKVEQDCPSLFSLTTDGIKVVRTYFNLADVDIDDPIFASSLNYNEIKIEPKFSFHQYHLNCFAMNLNKLFEGVSGYKYVDERHMTKSSYIRPDGLVVIDKRDVIINNQTIHLPETHVYLENDMGTETNIKIRQKFERYRAYMESSKHDPNVRMIVLFICRDKKLASKDYVDTSAIKGYVESPGIKKRINNIKKSISEALLDKIQDNLEIFVGTQPRLLAAMKVLYLPEYLCVDKKTYLPKTFTALKTNHGNLLDFKHVDKLLKFTNNVKYDLYAKSDQFQKSFIFLEYFGDPMSVIYKMEYHRKNTSAFRQTMKRELHLVVVATKEENLIALNEVCDLSNPKYDNIMFTTVKRINELPLQQAFFKFTSYGTAHYSDDFQTLIPDSSILN